MSLSCSEAGCRGSTQRPSRRNLTRVAQRSGQPIHGDLDRLGYEEGFVAGAVAAKQLELDSVERQQVGGSDVSGTGPGAGFRQQGPYAWSCGSKLLVRWNSSAMSV